MRGAEFGDFRGVFTAGHGLLLDPAAAAAAPSEAAGPGERGDSDGWGGRCPGAARRQRSAARPPVGTVGALLGREEELQIVRGAVRTRAMIEFTGMRGSGKTALLQAVAPDAYIRVGRRPFDDFLQDLVVEFRGHPSGGGRIPPATCVRILSEVRAVVALDDVAYGPGEIAELRRALAECAVLVGAREPVVGAMGVSYRLGGLTEPDAMALLARDTGRLIDPAELAAVRYLVAAVGGLPLAVRQVAALVRHRKFDLLSLATAISAAAQRSPGPDSPSGEAYPAGSPTPGGPAGTRCRLFPRGAARPSAGFSPSGPSGAAGSPGAFAPTEPDGYGSWTPGGALLEELVVSCLGSDALRLLAVLALAEGGYIPVRLLAAMAGVEDESPQLAHLTALGFAERRGDLAGLRSGSAEPCRRLMPHALDPLLAQRALTAWFAARDPGSPQVRPALGIAMALLRHAVDHGAWPAAHRIAASVEPALCLHGHWQDWHAALETAAEAAEHVAAPEAVAYTAHQLGTLHLLEGRPEAARAALARALDLRTRLADWEGAAVTRRTVGLVEPQPPAPGTEPAGPEPVRRRRGTARLAATVAVLAAGVGMGAAVSGFTGGRPGDTVPAATDGHGDPSATTGDSIPVPSDDPPQASPVDAQEGAAAPHTTAPTAPPPAHGTTPSESPAAPSTGTSSSSGPAAAPPAPRHAAHVPGATTGPTSLPSASRRPTPVSIAGTRH